MINVSEMYLEQSEWIGVSESIILHEGQPAFNVIDTRNEKEYPKYGYRVVDELHKFEYPKNTNSIWMTNCYTLEKGDWIGDEKTTKYLCKKRGIAPEKTDPDHCVCSIGFSEKEGKWFGWSHRAIYGFKPGDKKTKGMSGFEYLPKDFKKAVTMEDAKKMAIAFARSVS